MLFFMNANWDQICLRLLLEVLWGASLCGASQWGAPLWGGETCGSGWLGLEQVCWLDNEFLKAWLGHGDWIIFSLVEYINPIQNPYFDPFWAKIGQFVKPQLETLNFCKHIFFCSLQNREKEESEGTIKTDIQFFCSKVLWIHSCRRHCTVNIYIYDFNVRVISTDGEEFLIDRNLMITSN